MNDLKVGDTLYRIYLWDDYASSTVSDSPVLETCTVVKVSKRGLVYLNTSPKYSFKPQEIHLRWARSKREAVEKARNVLSDYTVEVLRVIGDAQNKLTEMDKV